MILLICAVFPPEPVVSASLADDLALALSEIFEVRVLTPRPSRPLGFSFKKENYKRREFEHIVLNSFTYPKSKIIGRLLESYSFGKHAAFYIKKNQKEIECIYLNTWPLFAQYLIVKAANKFSIPTVMHIQDIYPESLFGKLPVLSKFFIKLLIPFDKWIQKNSSKIVTISGKMKHFLIRSRDLEEQKVEVVYNWQNEERFITFRNSLKKDMRNSNFTFMFLGNLNRTAAVDVIIYAFKKSGLENARLVIAGSGSEKDSLLSLAASFKDINVELWDAPRIEVPEIQAKADVLLLNLKKGSALFALPSKIPAYMFSEKPIIACVEEESDTAYAIRQANCGWVVPPEDIVALASIMKTVTSISKDDLHSYGRNGFKYAMENYSKKHNLQKLVSIINEVVTETS